MVPLVPGETRGEVRVEALPDVQAAFRAGLAGRSLRAPAPTGLAEAPAAWSTGPNEALLATFQRLPGLTDPHAAYAAGRAVRRIMDLFDQANAPASVGRQFLDNLQATVTAQWMRDRKLVWGGSDTIAMFMEMYARILGETDQDYARVEASLLADALSDPGERTGGRGNALLKALRRRRD
jgi:hypothetical protein